MVIQEGEFHPGSLRSAVWKDVLNEIASTEEAKEDLFQEALEQVEDSEDQRALKLAKEEEELKQQQLEQQRSFDEEEETVTSLGVDEYMMRFIEQGYYY